MLFSICVERFFSICVDILFLDRSSKLCFFPIQLLIATKIFYSVLKIVLFGSKTALHKALDNCDIKSVKLLLNLRANPNLTDFYGRPTLYTKGALENLEILDLLLQHGTKPELLTCDGSFQTFSIFRLKGKKFIKKLLKYKVNLMLKDKRGNTPLHYMSENSESSSFVDLLEKFNFDVNIQNSNGETPLHYAWCIEYVKFLLDKGADVNIKSHMGDTPLTLALEFRPPGCKNIIELLLDHGTILDNETQIMILERVKEQGNYELIQPILARIALIHSLNTSTGERYRQLINNNTNMASYYDMCIREIRSMKIMHVNKNCKVTYFNILADKENQLITYLWNKKLKNHFDKINLASQFPIYTRIITNRLKKAGDKLILVQNAVNVLDKNIKQLNNNLYLIKNIVKYLGNHDLQLLM